MNVRCDDPRGDLPVTEYVPAISHDIGWRVLQGSCCGGQLFSIARASRFFLFRLDLAAGKHVQSQFGNVLNIGTERLYFPGA